MSTGVSPDEDLAEIAPWAFAFPLEGLLPGELALARRELECSRRLTRALEAELPAEAERRGIPCRPKLGVGEILSLEAEPSPTPGFR
ncbi:MAG: hypothetical protein MUE66_03525 [Acidimicrobiia bacterium]|jgi:hypothetical protein|nr:hypothetical protein [Acidimicrobiia bacterium]